MASNRLYKIRQFVNGRNREGEAFLNFSLTVPSSIVEMIPEDVQFSVSLTEEGILYSPVPVEEPQEAPSWVKNGAKASEPEQTPKKNNRRKRPAKKAA